MRTTQDTEAKICQKKLKIDYILIVVRLGESGELNNKMLEKTMEWLVKEGDKRAIAEVKVKPIFLQFSPIMAHR